MVCGNVQYMSCAVNEGRNTLDFNRHLNLITYAAYKKIVLYDPDKLCIVDTGIDCHDSIVTHVQWVRSSEKEESGLILSASSDGVAKLWFLADRETSQREDNSITQTLHLLVSLEGHKGSITTCASLYVPSKRSDIGKVFVVTACDEHEIKFWMVEADTGEYIELISHSLKGRSIVLCSQLIPQYISSSSKMCHEDYPLVILGGDDAKVHIYTFQPGICERVGVLSGHEDWITSLDAFGDENNDVMLASGSKDGSIRLWRISPNFKITNTELLYTKPIELCIPHKPKLDTDDIASSKLFCSLESVLIGHDGLVSRIEWKKGALNSPLQILSCAQTEDRSIIIWKEESCDTDISIPNQAIKEITTNLEDQNINDSKSLSSIDTNGIAESVDDFESTTKIWIEDTRLGEVGGNREGFFNASFGPYGTTLAATSYQGGIHLWKLEEHGEWRSKPAVNGHFKEVSDLSWGPAGSYLLTTSKDQTTRMHLKKKMLESNTWCEVSRPQVHGFDLTSIASLGRFKFISGGDEKVIRAFESTKHVIKIYGAATGEDVAQYLSDNLQAESASVPNLGLSNKALESKQPKILDSKEPDVKPERVQIPNESHLMMSTLWPEISKLYGHGNEILSIAANTTGCLVASSCRASNPDDAHLIIFDTLNWKILYTLPHHRLSVTQIAFSSCDNFILSGSRDRNWSVFRKGEKEYSFLSSSSDMPKKIQHSRVIWSVSWFKDDSSRFITGSRDKTVVVWRPVYEDRETFAQKDEDSSEKGLEVITWEREAVSQENEEVTAVDAHSVSKELTLLAIGTVKGSVILRCYSTNTKAFGDSTRLTLSHQDSVRRVAFEVTQESELLLASCGDDCTVFVHKIEI